MTINIPMIIIYCFEIFHVHFAIVKWKVSQTFHFSCMCVAPAALHIFLKFPINRKDLLTFILNKIPDH